MSATKPKIAIDWSSPRGKLVAIGACLGILFMARDVISGFLAGQAANRRAASFEGLTTDEPTTKPFFVELHAYFPADYERMRAEVMGPTVEANARARSKAIGAFVAAFQRREAAHVASASDDTVAAMVGMNNELGLRLKTEDPTACAMWARTGGVSGGLRVSDSTRQLITQLATLRVKAAFEGASHPVARKAFSADDKLTLMNYFVGLGGSAEALDDLAHHPEHPRDDADTCRIGVAFATTLYNLPAPVAARYLVLAATP